jgi:inorganic triphosphatase YgiF
MGLEIEAKFRVDDDLIFYWLPRLTSIGRFELTAEPTIEQQHNTYFDSADERLRAAGYSLRVREVAGQRTATLKRSRSRAGNLRIRDEWELPIGPGEDPRDWPGGELRERVLGVLVGAPVAPLFVVETRRQHIYAGRDGREVAEISLDKGIVRAGDLSEWFRELEVELRDQRERPAFDSLIGLLRLSFPLFPEERTKKARGLALRALAASPTLCVSS